MIINYLCLKTGAINVFGRAEKGSVEFDLARVQERLHLVGFRILALENEMTNQSINLKPIARSIVIQSPKSRR